MRTTVRSTLLLSTEPCRGRAASGAALAALLLAGLTLPAHGQSPFDQRTQFCSSPNVMIPDGDSNGITNQQDRDLGAPISDLDVVLVASHPRVGDLRFELTHLATGTQAILVDRPGYPLVPDGCTEADINANLSDEAVGSVENACSALPPAAISGEFRPQQPLSVFDGESVRGTWSLRASDHNASAVGSLTHFWLTPSLPSGTLGANAEPAFPTGIPIPDNDANGTVLSQAIGTEIADLDVLIGATHTWVGDLVITLEHFESGTTVTLLDRPGQETYGPSGCDGDDINAFFDDEGNAAANATCNPSPSAINGALRPPESLAQFDGESAYGAWRLHLSDEAGGDTGTLDFWCLLVQWSLLFGDGFESGGLDGWN